MALPEGHLLRPADTSDLPAIAALRESVGWAAHEWALQVVLRPPARCLVTVAPDGSLSAVGSGIAYGALGWVGNMVVATGFRRRGLGSLILREVITFLEGTGATRLELYATPDGRPLYARHGFEPDDQSAMVRIPKAVITAPEGVQIRAEGAASLDSLAAYDAPRFGGDRRPLLAVMVTDPERPLLVARRGGTMVGYVWLRRDGARLGPFLADDAVVAAALVTAAFDLAPEAEALTLNLPMANAPGTEWLRGLGVDLETWDGRMGRGPRIERRDETIYGNVVGALG